MQKNEQLLIVNKLFIGIRLKMAEQSESGSGCRSSYSKYLNFNFDAKSRLDLARIAKPFSPNSNEQLLRHLARIKAFSWNQEREPEKSCRSIYARKRHRSVNKERSRQKIRVSRFWNFGIHSFRPTWHCIVGRNFGSYVTHESKHFLYFYINTFAVLLFKAG